MVDVSNTTLLENFGKLRRGLNLTWVDGLKIVGLGTKQAMFLRHLSKHEAASQADLSRATLTDPAAVNRALESLLKKKWVSRVDDPEDGRRWIVRLTDEGWKVAKKVDVVYRELANGVFSILSVADKKVLHALLKRLTEDGLSKDILKELVE